MFGYKAYPTPILRPLAPFFAGGAIVFLGINALQNSLVKSDAFKNDPKNPYAQKVAKESGHH
ncbi:atp18 subunit J of the mitochondrial F1F0 ATP synthase [Tilletia horrida]|uniref:Atp18 subunit J of the mitochondrial F1F0 ATP synthase n=1 Tax=Tilletia horrida TaxID=155126 RepID=A0AAN6GG87_9BASI|nr:atp18 subunit J of the mitochondrial F1F0 ATP synthase [Tilletia horrida]KAK0531050.1 atp18 subunit J of the mitochondrial F1F0 ATP synthase [Tilletia horrida]KAK0535626.1 atp18 subunit J of the mitochondrial F1F0 ATP synthase [Tilletia horrida]KAK0561562.1 atp18 subunit J of the mitochondrial F1F0 ATP synthase [Tilletia horrida]